MTKVQTGSGHFTLATDLKVLSNHIFSDSAWLIPSILLIFITASDILSSATNQKFLANTFYVWGKTFAFVFQTNVFLIKVFPFSKGNTFMYFVWLFLLFFSAAITTTVRDISFRNLTTSFRMTPNRKPPGDRKNVCMITELCPRTPKTLFHWTGQNHNRYQNSDWWDELSD